MHKGERVTKLPNETFCNFFAAPLCDWHRFRRDDAVCRQVGGLVLQAAGAALPDGHPTTSHCCSGGLAFRSKELNIQQISKYPLDFETAANVKRWIWSCILYYVSCACKRCLAAATHELIIPCSRCFGQKKLLRSKRVFKSTGCF